MGEFVVYSVKVALCLVMFYVFYKLLLSHTTFHAFNRFVILATVVISLLLPFVHITFDEPNTVTDNVSVVPLIEMIKGEYEETAFDFSLIHLAVIIYIIGVVVFASRMIVSYACLYRMFGKANKVVTDEDGMRIYLMEGDVSPFSWFGHIVMSMEDYDHSSYKAIMVHEKAHVTLRHSADILFCNVLTVVQWFNPVVWLLKSDLQDIHEYEADDHVLKSGIDATGYQLLLVRKAVGGRLFAIANNLNKNSLQKRIKMMKTKKTNRWESMKTLVVLPLCAIAVVAFASTEMEKAEKTVVSDTNQMVNAVRDNLTNPVAVADVEKEVTVTNSVVANKMTVVSDTIKIRTDVFDAVEVMPEFPGGMDGLMNYLSENVQYPKESLKNNEHGRVVVSFIVAADGTVQQTKIKRSVSPHLDAEALRVVNAMPKWKPGQQDGKDVAVKYTLPVSFKLQKDKEDATLLILINGKKLEDTPYKSLAEIDESEIERMFVLKNSTALEKYGASGKDGVIVIELKQNKT